MAQGEKKSTSSQALRIKSLNKNLLQSEKALQTVDMEFNTRNAFAPRKGNIVRQKKRNARKERDFVDILYSVNQVQCTFDSPLTPNKSDDSFLVFLQYLLMK